MYEALMELMEPRLVVRDKMKMEEGIQQGLQEGIQQEKKMSALRMLKSGKYTLTEISDISGLSLKEIESLKEC